jgi:hypothetical protein
MRPLAKNVNAQKVVIRSTCRETHQQDFSLLTMRSAAHIVWPDEVARNGAHLGCFGQRFSLRAPVA